MSNTPCAYAVDSVLHRRVEIKTHKGRSPKGKNHPKVVLATADLSNLSDHHGFGVLLFTTEHQE